MTITDDKRPLHRQVSDSLRRRIHDRGFPPGDLLPSELALTEEFSVSRSVIRQALRTLREEGLIHTAPGRGAVVLPGPERHRDAQVTAGLSNQFRALGERISTEVLACEIRATPAYVHTFAEQALYLFRLRRMDEVPLALIRTWLPAHFADHLNTATLTDTSLHDELRRRFGLTLFGGQRQIRAVSASDDIATTLAVAPGAPLLLLEGNSVDHTGTTVEIFSTWHRSDLVALDVSVVGSSEELNALDTAQAALSQALTAIKRARGD